MRMEVLEMVLHRRKSHGVVEEVMVMAVVEGSKRRERQWRGAWRRGNAEHVRTRRRQPVPSRRRPCRLLPTLRVLELPELFLKMSEKSVEQVHPERHGARCKLVLNVRRIVGGGSLANTCLRQRSEK